MADDPQACAAAKRNRYSRFKCDEKGDIKCLPGWQGDLCDVPLCKRNCDPQQGYCTRPGECRCKLGFTGSNCNKCITLPGCQHGTCTGRQAFECLCKEGWSGIFCQDREFTYCTFLGSSFLWHVFSAFLRFLDSNLSQRLQCCSWLLRYTKWMRGKITFLAHFRFDKCTNWYSIDVNFSHSSAVLDGRARPAPNVKDCQVACEEHATRPCNACAFLALPVFFVTKVSAAPCNWQKSNFPWFSEISSTRNFPTAICSETCHKANGYCRTPGTCRCKVGWMGDDCSVVSLCSVRWCDSWWWKCSFSPLSSSSPPTYIHNNNSVINIQAARMAIVYDHG